MRTYQSLKGCAVGLLLLGHPTARAADAPTFRAQTIDPEVGKVCYAVVTTDVDGDGKPDVVAAANDAVVWYQNPTWRKRDILRGGTEPDNVCLQPHDVDGDGRVDFALGSAWRPTDTQAGGHLAIVTRTGAAEGSWRVVPVVPESANGFEPTLHRIRWGRLTDFDARPRLIVAPLHGRGTRGPDWANGSGARIIAYSIPGRPFEDRWPFEVIEADCHAVHNIQVIDPAEGRRPRGLPSPGLLMAAWEGVVLVYNSDFGRASINLGLGDRTSRPNQGTSEVKSGRRRDGSTFLAAIEPWHGSQFVAYHGLKDENHDRVLMARHVIAEGITWGHAVWCVDLDGDGDDEVVVGQRDANPQAEPGRRGPGVMIFDPVPGSDPIAFDRRWVDEGGVAVEDLVAADLDGDGRPEIIAGGRATHNVRIYWNERPARP